MKRKFKNDFIVNIACTGLLYHCSVWPYIIIKAIFLISLFLNQVLFPLIHEPVSCTFVSGRPEFYLKVNEKLFSN